ncbi:hypothetical protein HanIR_Chr04g0167131 [Helianthus annuus]|nr:hypothetical protein HanIR_Chr04g0167131 [Helianthus annuus]
MRIGVTKWVGWEGLGNKLEWVWDGNGYGAGIANPNPIPGYKNWSHTGPKTRRVWDG